MINNSYHIVLDTDDWAYKGQQRINHNIECLSYPEPWDGRDNHLFVSYKYLVI